MPLQRPKRVLIIFFSFSGQTRKLVRAVARGFDKAEIETVLEPLAPTPPFPFPLHSARRTLRLMFRAMFRPRVDIAPLSQEAGGVFDLVVLAGPTWSYNPSGPILTFLDRDGEKIFQNRPVQPVISCRSYWRLHWWSLRKRIQAASGTALPPWIYTHVAREPWRTIGVFLTLAGKNPKKFPVLKLYYSRYGHGENQIQDAEMKAMNLGKQMQSGKPFLS